MISICPFVRNNIYKILDIALPLVNHPNTVLSIVMLMSSTIGISYIIDNIIDIPLDIDIINLSMFIIK